MTDREKLIDLISDFVVHVPHEDGQTWEEACADYLLTNGATFGKDTDVTGKWVPVSERLPEKLTPVLIRNNYMEWAGTTVGYITTGWYWEWFAYFMGDDMLHYPMGGGTICPGSEYVTHWMPLPKTPKEG